MASKTNKEISLSAFEKVAKDYIKTSTIEWNGLQVVIKKNLSLEEMSSFVDIVVRGCFDEDKCIYMPEVKDCIIRSGMIDLYTNISLSIDDVFKKYALLYATDIIDIIFDHIDMKQFSKMIEAIDAKIKYITDTNITASVRQLDALFNSLESMQNQLSSIFNGIGADDIKNIAGAISNGKLDEGKLVKAIFESKE